MLKAVFKITYKSLLKHKSRLVLNVLGLAGGFTFFILIGLFIMDEFSYDEFHSKHNRVYRVMHLGDYDGMKENSTSCPFPLGPAISNAYPDIIEKSVRLFNFQNPQILVRSGKVSAYEKNFFYADTTIFDVFDLDIIKGDLRSFKEDTYKLLISEKTAKKYFEDENPIGKLFKIDSYLMFRVAGVFEDLPEQSHVDIDFLASMTSVEHIYKGKLPSSWTWNPCWTYLLLNEGKSADELALKLPKFVNQHFYDVSKEATTLKLQALTDIHLKSNFDFEIKKNGNINTVYVLMLISIFILLISGINYVNLSTAGADIRIKEIAVKKINGATRTNLVFQFLLESLLLTFISLLIALLFVELSLPIFNQFTNKHLIFLNILDTKNVLILLGVALGTGLLSGVFPAIYLSKLNPLQILSSNVRNSVKTGRLRIVLIFIQFLVASVMISGTIISNKQIAFLYNIDPGFRKNNILIIPAGNSPIAYYFDEFKAKINNKRGIVSVTAMDYIIGKEHNSHEFLPEGADSATWKFYPAIIVRDDFVKTFDIKMIKGRGFIPGSKTDTKYGLLINKSMVKSIGKNIDNVIGTKFKTPKGSKSVIGVFDDFLTGSVHSKSGPFILTKFSDKRMQAHYTKYIAVYLNENRKEEALNLIQDIWNDLMPDYPFEYEYLNDVLKEHYIDEKTTTDISKLFTGLILGIAMIGLIGLSSFLINRRKKEIYIRKIMGATGIELFNILIKDFVLIVSIANVLSIPISYYLMSTILSTFTQSISINTMPFVVSYLICFMITIGVVLGKSIQILRSNPTNYLKMD